jgi:hypothetical protein
VQFWQEYRDLGFPESRKGGKIENGILIPDVLPSYRLTGKYFNIDF